VGFSKHYISILAITIIITIASRPQPSVSTTQPPPPLSPNASLQCQSPLPRLHTTPPYIHLTLVVHSHPLHIPKTHGPQRLHMLGRLQQPARIGALAATRARVCVRVSLLCVCVYHCCAFACITAVPQVRAAALNLVTAIAHESHTQRPGKHDFAEVCEYDAAELQLFTDCRLQVAKAVVQGMAKDARCCSLCGCERLLSKIAVGFRTS
jgi:hypothetical protein